MFEPFSHHQPADRPAQAVELFQLHQLAQDFRLEQEHRLRFDQHCRWYEHTAQQIQADLRQMQIAGNLPWWPRRNSRL